MSLDDLQAQLRGALDQQFATLKQHYEQAVADARRQGLADGERTAAARVDAARAEWQTELEQRIVAARSEGQQQALETGRNERRLLEQQLQQQLEQTIQHAVNSVKRSSEIELDTLRRRLDDEFAAERQKGQTGLDTERRQAQEAQAQAHDLIERANRAVAEEQARAAAELEAVKQLLEAEIAAAQGQATAAHEDLAAARAQAESSQKDIEAAKQQAASANEEAAAARTQAASAAEDAAVARAQAASAADEAAAAKARAASAEEGLAALKAQAESSEEGLAAAQAQAAPAVIAGFDRLPPAVRSLDAAASLSQTLDALLQHAGAIAGRAALFLIDGDRLKAWKTVAIPEIDVQTVESSIGGGDLLVRAIQSGQATPATASLPAPPFARLTGDQAVAVPLMINGRAVAVLYADSGGADAPSGWVDAVDVVTRHASAMAALRAAMRTLDVLRGGAPDPAAAGNGEEGARRYARLLVSEIKLYNEAAVRDGRRQRDLRQRLRGEIDRALRLYEERVPPAVGAREQYFQQELVQTLADGDPSLLGT
jgi:hypothetical protein